VVRVRRESKGRGGKTVTVIAGVPGNEAALKLLAGELKRRCGTGGTLKEGMIEIQGDHCDLLVTELSGRGFKVKRAGG
jgi:translation initiation factor 1